MRFVGLTLCPLWRVFVLSVDSDISDEARLDGDVGLGARNVCKVEGTRLSIGARGVGSWSSNSALRLAGVAGLLNSFRASVGGGSLSVDD